MSKKKTEEPAPPPAAQPEPEAAPPAPPDPEPDPVPDAPVAAAEAAAPEATRYFRVERLAKYVLNGAVSTLSEGAVITNLTHDLKDVVAQGVPLVEVTAADVPQPRPLVQ